MMKSILAFALVGSLVGAFVVACSSSDEEARSARPTDDDDDDSDRDDDVRERDDDRSPPSGSVYDAGPDGSYEGPHGGAKRVFVTSESWTGDLKRAANTTDGMTGADKLCATAALNAGIPGAWRAFVSGKSAGGSTVHAPERIAGDGPWQLLNGRTVFANRAQLSGNALVGIDVDEHGNVVSSLFQYGVWTGTRLGAYDGPACELGGKSWESGNQGKGRFGWSSQTAGWTSAPEESMPCSGRAKLYCFEQ